MDTMTAVMMNRSTPNGNEKVFDWDEAARIIKQRKPMSAVAGLRGDMEWTSGTIYEDGEPVFDDYTYLQSRWATPILVLWNEDTGGIEMECFKPKGYNGWNEKTKWPESALAILNG